MKPLPLAFVVISTVALLIGTIWGLCMAVAMDRTMSPAHGQLNLVGWVTGAIYGLTYHAVPGAADTGLARLHFIVQLFATAAMPAGMALAISGAGEMLAGIGAAAALISATLFLVNVLTNGCRLGA